MYIAAKITGPEVGRPKRQDTTGRPFQLTAMLERCDGVLEPPRKRDSDIEVLTPDVGATPIMPPEALPGQ